MRLTAAVENALQRVFLFPCLILVTQLLLPHATGRPQQRETATSSCVSPEMARLIVQERDGVRVNSPRDSGNETAAARDNVRAVIATKAPETTKTMKEARKLFEKAARQGYAPAEVDLAVLSLAGWGTRPDAGEALYWLHSAADQGYAPALFDPVSLKRAL